MTLQTIEPVLYLPDDNPFFAEPGDVWLGRRLVARSLGFFALCAIVYLPVFIWGGFVWQDEWRVTQNVLLWGTNGLAGIWSHAMGGPYRPLAQTFLWGEHHFFASHPLPYHITSVLFHGVNAGLAWMVLRRLGIRGAWLGAALFAVHPVQVQSVAWISQQSHLIGAGFCLGAIWAYLRLSRVVPQPRDENGETISLEDWDDLLAFEPVKSLYVLSLSLAIAATLSDPVAIGLPLILLILLGWKRGRVRLADGLRLVPFFAIAAIASVAGIMMAAHGNAPDPAGAGPALSVAQRLVVDCRMVWASAAAVVWPYPLLFVYSRWNPSGSWQLAFPAALLLLAIGGWAARRWVGRGLSVATLLFIVLLLPGIVVVCGSRTPPIYVADHWEYLAAIVPMALISAAVVLAASWFSSAILVRSLRGALAAVLIGVLGFLTWQQGTIYDREESAWQDALAFQPASSVAVNQYVRLLLANGNDREAADVLGRAQAAGGDEPSLLPARIQLNLARGRFADVIRCYREALAREPDNEQYLAGLAEAYDKSGDGELAIETYRDLLHRRPNDVAIQTGFGLLLLHQKKIDQAVAELRAAVAANPRFVPARIYLAVGLLLKGDLNEVAGQLKQAVALDPANSEAFNIAGTVLFDMKYFAQAEQMFRAVVQLNPKSAEAWDRLGLAQAAQGRQRLREAVWNFDRANQLDPSSDAAREHLDKARRDLAAAEK